MRGLKHIPHGIRLVDLRRTRMGAWIETAEPFLIPQNSGRRTRMGAWIETDCAYRPGGSNRVAPVWVRGLKPFLKLNLSIHGSRTRMGAWIETILHGI